MTARKICMLLLFCWSAIAMAQQKAVTGKVQSAEGEPLSGATVKLKGSNIGTATNANGEFSIQVPQGATLVISYVGYQTKEVKVKSSESLSIKLSPSTNNQLSDVVIVGVQKQTKRTTTSSISSISGKQIENLPVASPDILLQGRVPGLNVQVVSGEPGVAPTMVVRGNTRVSQNIGGIDQARALSGPLYVIDGVPVNPEDVGNSIDATGTNYLAGINVNDIESIDVQKDAAAAAAWGSRGANGVIYITTRKGRSKRPEFRVNVYGGVTEQPELLPTVTGAEERAQKIALAKQYGTPGQMANLPQLLTDSLNPYFNNATDWQGLFYRNGVIKNVDMSMSAATDVVNYRLSANYYNEQGVIKAFGFKRYSMRGNFDFKISPKLNSQLVIGLSKSDRQRGRKYNNSDDNTPVSSFNIPGSFYRLTSFDSLNFTGLYDKLRNENNNNWYSASLTLNYDILKGLRFTTQGSANVTTSDRDYFQPTDIDQVQAAGGNNQRSYAEANKGTYTNYFLSNTLNYFKSLEAGSHSHNFVATLSQQFTRDIYKTSIAAGYDVPSNDIQVVQGIPQQSLYAYSSYGASSILSYLGQVQYDFDKKYILYAAQRADASSRFGASSKWGYFPSVGAGWVISDEKFMSGTQNWLNFLKLRASYGQTGSQSPDYYAPYNSYQLSGTYNGVPVIQPSYTNGLTKDNLTWAKTEQKNIALESQLFNNRISLTIDAYDKLTKGDYFSFNLPFYTGYDAVTFNANDLWVNNRGVEFTLSTHNFSPQHKLQWNTQLNLAFNKNVIAKLPNNNRTFIQDDYYGVTRIYSVGQPIYQMFQMEYLGVYNNFNEIPFNPATGQRITYFKGNHTVQPGDPVWRDVNGDYDVWSDEDNGDGFGDRVPTGDPNPKFTGGLVNDFSYGNFNLTVIGVFAFKRDVINSFDQNQLYSVFNNGGINSFAKTRLPDLNSYNYWTPAGAVKDPTYKAGFPALNPFGNNFYQFLPFSSMFNEDGSYFKVKSLILGYRLPKKITDKIKLNGVRFYGVMDNVLILKNSSLPDPELVNELGVYTGGAYPIPHKFTFGVDVQF
ncbi:MAG: SusC/RagA family TonB-linked outer membrane protein [Flavisolibacter sp.]